MLEACNKLYKERVHVRVGKVIPFEEEIIREEVKAVGETKRFGKVVIQIAGDT
jgi:hypothetical protein